MIVKGHILPLLTQNCLNTEQTDGSKSVSCDVHPHLHRGTVREKNQEAENLRRSACDLTAF